MNKSFKYCPFTLVTIVSISTATIINVPADLPTIQAGIDSAFVGDTVLVDSGRYVENINFNGKNIVVGSLFLITGNTSYISQTVVDGDQKKSVVMFESGQASNTVICGFTITNGFGHDPTWEIPFPPTAIGGGITCRDSSSPTLRDLIIANNRAVAMGGGIYCLSSNPLLINVTIANNSAHRGGGICCDFSNPSLNHVVITGNSAWHGGGIFCYESSPVLTDIAVTVNAAILHGGGVYCEGNSVPVFNAEDRSNLFLNLAGDTGYDLYASGEVIINVVVDTFTVMTPAEYHAYPIEKFEFDILNAEVEQAEADLYVDPSGSNDNSGLSPVEPLRSIGYALAKVDADSSHPHTIHLGEGVYSPSAIGENYPLYWRSYVSLLGAGKGITILDAEGQNGVVFCYHDSGFSIESLTIRNSAAGYWGGAIDCNRSSPNLSNLEICDNSCTGIYCWDRSSPILTNVTISRNMASRGGGIYCALYSNPTLTNVTIMDNTGGGGIYCWEHSSPILTHVTISGNSGGGISCDDYSSPFLSNVTINDNTGRGIYCVNGSNAVLEYVTINENTRGGLWLGGSDAALTNVTIIGNTTDGAGGGIGFSGSSAVLTNVIIAGNSAYVGGGIYCSGSSPILTNVTITGNSIDEKYVKYQNGGGIYCFDHSYPTMVNTILWDNEPQEIYYSGSLPDDSNSFTISYSDVQGGEAAIITNDRGTVTWQEGNIDEYPLFCNPDSGVYTLAENSPCLGTGQDGANMGALGMECEAILSTDVSTVVPIEFALHQNYPNPFNPVTTIRFDLPQVSAVHLIVYDLMGREVARLADGTQQPGYHQVVWNGRTASGRDVASGIYIARLITPGYTKSIKIVLLK